MNMYNNSKMIKFQLIILSIVINQILNSCIELKSILGSGIEISSGTQFTFNIENKYHALSFYFRTNFLNTTSNMTVISLEDPFLK